MIGEILWKNVGEIKKNIGSEQLDFCTITLFPASISMLSLITVVIISSFVQNIYRSQRSLLPIFNCTYIVFHSFLHLM